LREVERYAQEFDRERLARTAIERTQREHRSANLTADSGKPAKKR
jgi:hypothetical protein